MTDLSQILLFILAFFGVFFGLSIVMVFVINRTDSKKQRAEPNEQAAVREKVIIKEVVMIPCHYCGALTPQTSIFCPNCGAKRKAN